MTLKQLLAVSLGMGFVVLAALQYSRPDAVLWIATYLTAAIFCFMAALERISRALLLVAFIAYIAGAFYFWPGLSFANSELKSDEGLSVALSLIIAGLAMLFFGIFNRRKTHLHPPYDAGRLKKWAS